MHLKSHLKSQNNIIQISLDKVLNFGAVSTLYILVMGVCAALIFNGILGYVRDYVINFISTSIEARLSGDIFDKVMAMPAATFQTGSSSEFEAILQASGKIKTFISTQILKTIFDATTILVFLPVLFGYSPILALIVTIFSMAVGAITLFGRWRQKEAGKTTGPIEASKRRVVQSSEMMANMPPEAMQGMDAPKMENMPPEAMQEKRQNSLEANFSEKLQQSDDKISLLSADTQKELAAIALDFASKSSSLETVLLDKMEHTFAESNSKIDGIEHLVNNNIINSSQANKALQERVGLPLKP